MSCSLRRRRARSMSRQTRPRIVVSHPVTLATAPGSARLARSQTSCTASSASSAEPSMRNATARRWPRARSSCSASAA
ncbi:hypothetical protein BE08_14130 [Sorangium cellulosum]|uniref:Uncharacterized protein n=1 Tax=Sorangium cellulosum TaxID=56 RepID=A0A150NY56_SORCE|nr:hypothetical protein BE08_14130 [Sorangium cellulosum]